MKAVMEAAGKRLLLQRLFKATKHDFTDEGN